MTKPNNLICTLVIFIICLFSCNQKTDTSKNESQNTENNMIAENSDFPVIRAECSGFKKYEKTKELFDDGTALGFKITYKNNTPNKITNFKLIYFLEAKYEDGTTLYFPSQESDGKYKDDKDFEERFSNNFNINLELDKNEIWIPKTEREFKFDVFYFKWIGQTNGFKDKMFERTPTELNLITRYTATSIDGEYTNTTSDDVLKFWKDYQKEIGLR